MESVEFTFHAGFTPYRALDSLMQRVSSGRTMQDTLSVGPVDPAGLAAL